MNGCIFCKIIDGSIPSYKIYEDESTYAFLDNSGDVRAHTLVVPKRHFVNVLDCPQELYSRVMATVQKISRHYIEKGLCDGINIVINNGESAEQQIPHFHVHIIPRVNDTIPTIYADLLQNAYDMEKVQEEFKMFSGDERKHKHNF